MPSVAISNRAFSMLFLCQVLLFVIIHNLYSPAVFVALL